MPLTDEKKINKRKGYSYLWNSDKWDNEHKSSNTQKSWINYIIWLHWFRVGTCNISTKYEIWWAWSLDDYDAFNWRISEKENQNKISYKRSKFKRKFLLQKKNLRENAWSKSKEIMNKQTVEVNAISFQFRVQSYQV